MDGVTGATPPNGQAAAVAIPAGVGQAGLLLQPGQSVDATVVAALAAGRFLIAIGGRQVAADSSADLPVGSRIRMSVSSADRGGIVLRLAGAVSADTSNPAQRLEALRLPPTAAAAEVLAAFEDAGAPLDPRLLRAALAATTRPQATPAAPVAYALLARAGLPATPALVQLAERAATGAPADLGSAVVRLQQAADAALPAAVRNMPAAPPAAAGQAIVPPPADPSVGRLPAPPAPATTVAAAPASPPSPSAAPGPSPAGPVPTAQPLPTATQSGPASGSSAPAPSTLPAPVPTPTQPAASTTPQPSTGRAMSTAVAPPAGRTDQPMTAASAPIPTGPPGATPAPPHRTTTHTSTPPGDADRTTGTAPQARVSPTGLPAASRPSSAEPPSAPPPAPAVAPPVAGARPLAAGHLPEPETAAAGPAPGQRLVATADTGPVARVPDTAAATTTAAQTRPVPVSAAVPADASRPAEMIRPAPARPAAPTAPDRDPPPAAATPAARETRLPAARIDIAAEDVPAAPAARTGDARLAAIRSLAALVLPDPAVDGAPAVARALRLAGVAAQDPAGAPLVHPAAPDTPLARQLAALAESAPHDAAPPGPTPPPADDAVQAAAGRTVREQLAEQVFKPKDLADYDRVVPLPLAAQQVPTPARLAVATRSGGGGQDATFLRVDAELSRLGPVSLRMSGIGGGPLAITLVARPGAAAELAGELPAMIEDLRAAGVEAGVRIIEEDQRG